MFGLAFHHQHGLFGSSMGQHFPAVTLTHVPAKDTDGQKTKKKIRLQINVFFPVSTLTHFYGSPGQKSLQMLVHDRKMMGNNLRREGKKQQEKEKLKRKHQRAQPSGDGWKMLSNKSVQYNFIVHRIP